MEFIVPNHRKNCIKKAFGDSSQVVTELPHSGLELTSMSDEKVDKVKDMVLKNHHCGLRELNISHESLRFWI